MSLTLLVYLPIIYFPLLYLIVYLVQKIQSTDRGKLVVISYSVVLGLIFISCLAIAGDLASLKNLVKQLLLPLISVIISLFVFKDIKLKFNLQLTLTYIVCLLFLIGVSILVPVGTSGLIAGGKQWGVRFLLMLVPIVCLAIAKEVDIVCQQNKSIAKYWVYILLAFLSILGIHKNIIQGTAFLQKNTLNTISAVHFLRQDNNQNLAISHQFVGQALEAAVDRNKIFFKVENEPDLIKLSKSLIQQQQAKFTYICYPNRPCNLPKAKPSNLQFTQGDRQYQIIMTELGKFGKYPIYEVLIEKNNY